MTRVLVADDDRVVRATMPHFLGTKGHDVVEAASSRSGSGSSKPLKLGAASSLRKPFRASELLTAVEDCLNIPAVEENVQPDDWQGRLKSSA
jgi:DNA-binding NtrC family response regulator